MLCSKKLFYIWGDDLFKPIKNKKVYEHVVEQIQDMVMNRTLKIGDKLPSERELVEQLGVSRTSIREAMRALEVVGLVESRQGEGNFISGNIDNSFLEPLSVMFMLKGGCPNDILELRRIIELEAVRKAAEKINEKEKEEIKEIMDSLRSSENEKESSFYDKQLHYKISEITGNYLIITMMKAVESLMESFIGKARGMILHQAESKDLLMKQHEAICNALYNNDPEAGVKAMEAHLEEISRTISK